MRSEVVLTTGAKARLRALGADDAEGVHDLCAHLSDHSRYLRFFSPMTVEQATRWEQRDQSDDDHFSLVAELDGKLLGIARFERASPDDGEAEVAFVVRDDEQGHGVGTALLEALADAARARGVQRFLAWTLVDNQQMLDVFAHAGYPVRRTFDGSTVGVTLDLGGRA